MATGIKHKIRLGTVFLFVLLLLSGGLSIYYLTLLKHDAGNILKDNYTSIEYCHAMQQSIDSIQHGHTTAAATFNRMLSQQEKNITEQGEAVATQNIRNAFEAIEKGDTAGYAFNRVKAGLQNILSVNMHAIERKNALAEQSAGKASTVLIAIFSVIVLVGVSFAYNFPAVLTSPIGRFMDAVKELSRKNYKHRIHIDNKDEFGELADAFNSMAERLEAFESSNLNKLIFEKARAEAVINSLKDASIGIDANNLVLFANAQALQLLNLKTEDTVGKSATELAAKNDLFKFLWDNDSTAPFKIVVAGKENYYAKEVLQVQQGTQTHKVIVLKNITSFKELDVAKTNFIATVSHELKTPLASSDFSLRLLEDKRIGTLTAEQQDLVQQLKNDNQRMLKILSELLNMGQVESGKIQLDMQPVSPYHIVEASLASIAVTVKQKNILLASQFQPNLAKVQADADKAVWVLNNFLTNAIKYSKEGSTVTVTLQATANGVEFAVTDNGPGIEAIYLSRIFERYFRIPGRDDAKGSGIGLAICKEFIEAMQGHIWVTSQTGKGSTFAFALPA
jgi:signal transduction histidine kinase